MAEKHRKLEKTFLLDFHQLQYKFRSKVKIYIDIVFLNGIFFSGKKL